MDEDRIIQILENLRLKYSTDNLLKELSTSPPGTWTEEGLEAAKRLLKESNIEYKGIPEVLQFDVKFRTHLDRISGKCPYIGNGTIYIFQNGLKLFGNKVYSRGAQIAFGGLILLFYLLLQESLGFSKIGTPGILMIIYFTVTFIIRKERNIYIPWKNITAIEHDSELGIIGIDFCGFPDCHPVVFTSKSDDILFLELNRRKINDKES